MNIVQLEAEFLKDPNPSRTVLKGIARANRVEVLEVEEWFENRRLQDPEVKDLVQDVPGPSEARGVRRGRERSEHREQDHHPVKRPAIENINAKLDHFLHNPTSQEFLLGLIKIIGVQPSEAETNNTGRIAGVNPNVIRHWTSNLEDKGPVQPPTIDRSQPPTYQPPTQQDGVVKENRPIDDRYERRIARRNARRERQEEIEELRERMELRARGAIPRDIPSPPRRGEQRGYQSDSSDSDSEDEPPVRQFLGFPRAYRRGDPAEGQ